MKKKVGKNNHRTPAALGPRSAVLELSNALARTAFFLAALSPREFHRATETGSNLMLGEPVQTLQCSNYSYYLFR